MPHHLGDAPPEQRTFQYCTNWYAPLTQMWAFELSARRWSQETVACDEVPEPGDTLVRSHASAVVAPRRSTMASGGRRSQGLDLGSEVVLLFGGSRYFTGAYFHDLLELRHSPPPMLDGIDGVAFEAEDRQRLVAGDGLFQRFIRRVSASSGGAAGAAGAAAGNPPHAAADGARGRGGRVRAMVRDGVWPPVRPPSHG